MARTPNQWVKNSFTRRLYSSATTFGASAWPQQGTTHSYLGSGSGLVNLVSRHWGYQIIISAVYHQKSTVFQAGG